MNKRLIIILSFAIPIVIAAVVVLILWLVQPNTSDVPNEGNNQTSEQDNSFVPDLSIDFGACDMTSKEFIQSAFSGNLPSLQDAHDLGKVFSGSAGVQTHICAYYLDNDQVLTNSVNIVVMSYDNTENHDSEKSSIYADATPVAGISDSAVYYSIESPDEDEDTIVQQSIRVDRGDRAYVITLSQPAEAALSADTTRSALESIAKSATYSN